jgi:hypothetical protein
MPSGRPPKPVEQKRALGNPGKRALPKPAQYLEPISDIPQPSRPLLKPGLELWERVWKMGAKWIIPNSDFELLLMTCEMVDERWNLRVKVMQDSSPKERRGLRELDRLIIGNLALLGFTPADRTRLGLAEVKAQSKLAELIAKRDEL